MITRYMVFTLMKEALQPPKWTSRTKLEAAAFSNLLPVKQNEAKTHQKDMYRSLFLHERVQLRPI